MGRVVLCSILHNLQLAAQAVWMCPALVALTVRVFSSPFVQSVKDGMVDQTFPVLKFAPVKVLFQVLAMQLQLCWIILDGGMEQEGFQTALIPFQSFQLIPLPLQVVKAVVILSTVAVEYLSP